MKIDILVVSFHAKEKLAQTLAALALFSSPGYRLTVHDNTARNYSLTWLWNRFAERSKREYLAFVNSDVIVGPGWDTEAVACMDEDPSVANVSPVSNYPYHRNLAPIPEPNEHAMDWIEKLTMGLKGIPNRFYKTTEYYLVAGHCMVMRHSAYRKVRGFNEAFPFANNDWDMNQRLVAAGYKMGVCLHAPSLHWWNASTKDAKAKGVSPGFAPTPAGATFDTV